MNPLTYSRLGRLLVLCSAFWLSGTMNASAAVPQGFWIATGSPIANLAAGASLLALADGTPLLFGLDAGAVQQYHLDSGTWTTSGALQVRRSTSATVTLLSSGLVLLAGGVDSSGNAISSAELYNPATGTSTLVAPMHFTRSGHQATRLVSGKVLVSGGTDASKQVVGPAEIYDPTTETWSLTGALRARYKISGPRS